MAFIHRSLELLFKVCVVSLSVSAIFGLGEVYTQGGELQQRAFSWLGDSFSPVMIFFLYYYTFRKKKIEFLLSLACIVVIMQAKMAIIMAVLGYFFYLFLFSQPVKRLFLTAALAIILLTLPMLFEIAVNNIHNFEYSLNNRLFSFNASLHFFWSSPLFGVGINQTFKLLTNDFDVTSLELYVSDIKYYEILQIHNSFLRILSELGVFGFLFFAAFCIVIVRRSYFILISVQLLPLDNTRALLMACSLWLISFVLFYQTTGWFEPGHPQLAWLICFLTLMNFAYLSLFDSNTALSKRIRYT
jgi:O-antigen ligase